MFGFSDPICVCVYLGVCLGVMVVIRNETLREMSGAAKERVELLSAGVSLVLTTLQALGDDLGF